MNADALIGAVLGTYTLQKLIGRGGIGVVFLAQQSHPERQVALKVLLPMLSLPPDQCAAFLARFQHEFAEIAPLKHPHILPIYEYNEFYGLAYLAMPYIHDNTLHDEMRREGALPLEKVALYLEQILSACAFSHEHNVIHGNVKPANVFVQRDGHVLLTDFGLMKTLCEGDDTGSRLIKSKLPSETLDYIAPGQSISSYTVDKSTDIYSLGIILYQMVTGVLPFYRQKDTHWEYISPPPPRLLRPELSIALEQVILKALELQPTERYQSVNDFATAFRAALVTSGIPVTDLDKYNAAYASDDSLLTPDSSFSMITQTSLLAANNQKKDQPDTSSDAVAPTQKIQNKAHKNGIIDRTRFSIPSMSGFLEPSFSQSASTIPDILPVPPQIPDGTLETPPLSANKPSPKTQLVTEEPGMQLSQILATAGVQLADLQLQSPSPSPAPILPPNYHRSTQKRPKHFRLLLACIILFVLLIFGVSAYLFNNTGIMAGTAPAKGSIQASQTTSNTNGGTQNTPSVNNTANGGNNAANGDKSFQVGVNELIVLKGHHSDVHIQGASGDTATLTTRQHGNNRVLDANDSRITYEQTQGHINVATEPGLDVDYNMTVPSTTRIQVLVDTGSVAVSGVSAVTVDTGAGNLDVENINGPVDISTVNGDVIARTLTGQTIIRSVNGSIRTNNVSGVLNAVTSSGDVVVRAALLNGASVLATSNGSVHFEGAIDANGTYKMKTNNGNIDLTLPNNTAFQLNARTHSGSVRNDFAGNVVGDAPRAQITATIGSGGSITINKAN